ncbi:hypothetical protein HFP57_01395 [Parasphingopyxis algicola]|uniref:hypothetical protein n=1 Tax=Parasphingopyxis algicola TaxID=2026624 RepID=UPI00159FA26B|nr:hypothetical protein [Parasphingopyxis algicola]QLC23818.1 hypothetical protein HFP57_01395 [Parasphingopyxis algicola]
MPISIIRTTIVLLAASLLAACSMQGMIETMTSEEDRAMAQEFVDNIRNRNDAGIEAMVDPDLWKSSADQFAQAAELFPDGESETKIIAYSMNSNGLGENARTVKDFTLVTTDERHWTTTRFSTFQQGGDPVITSWNVEGSGEPPADLEVMETVGNVFMWAGIVALLIFAGIVALIVWLVRRSKRKDRERAGIS